MVKSSQSIIQKYSFHLRLKKSQKIYFIDLLKSRLHQIEQPNKYSNFILISFLKISKIPLFYFIIYNSAIYQFKISKSFYLFALVNNFDLKDALI